MSAFTLRLTACIAMLIDHLGYQYGILPFRLIGRIAFPIFVFLLVNGLEHTTSPLRYALRLGVFAVLSQVPFSLFSYGQLWNSQGNVFFTLFFALVALMALRRLSEDKRFRLISWVPALLIILIYEAGWISSDYGARGILLALLMYAAYNRGTSGRWILAVGMILLTFYPVLLSVIRAEAVQFTQWEALQLYAIFSLPFIWLYNGKKGGPHAKTILGQKLLQYGFYAFYPVHQLVLWLLR